MRRAAVFFQPVPRSTQAPLKNRDPAGYGSWERSIEEQTVQVMVTNTLGQVYYADAKDMMAEAEGVMAKMLAKDPEFFAKAIVYSREKGFMRTLPILGLVTLFSDTVGKQHAKKIFQRVIRTPNDLSDFTSILKSKRKGEGGRAVKTAAGKWLIEKLSDFWVVKYGSEKADGSYSLRDLLQVYHPNAKRKIPMFDFIMGRAEADLSDLPMIRAFEALKKADSAEAKIKAITEGRLPHEVATSFAGSDKKVWGAIVPNMPIFALMRNLATLERHGVADDNKERIQKMFSDPAVIGKSMILPFRFSEAEKHVNAPWIKDCLRDGLELSFNNLPDMPGKTAVMLDISGSMNGRFLDVGSVFGLALMKKSKGNGRFILFDTRADDFPFSMRDSILTQAQKIMARGGTDHSVAMQKLGNDRVDQIVYITDEQQNHGTPLVDMLDKYRQRVNKDVKVFIVDVSGYRNALTPDDKDTWYMYGWSDSALSFIATACQGWGGQVDFIRKIEL